MLSALKGDGEERSEEVISDGQTTTLATSAKNQEEGGMDGSNQSERMTLASSGVEQTLSATQATELATIVNQCMRCLRQLPAHRRDVYLSVLRPRVAAASGQRWWTQYDSSAPFLRQLCAEMQSEVSRYTDASGGSSSLIKMEGGGKSSNALLADKKPQALLQLLESMEKQVQQTRAEDLAAASLITSERDQAITALYVSPFAHDAITHHSPGTLFGFGASAASAASVGGGASSKSTTKDALKLQQQQQQQQAIRRHPAGNRNPKLPFAYPAASSKEVGGVSRQWYLKEAAWTSTPDFGALQFVVPRKRPAAAAAALDSSSSGVAALKKRPRDGDDTH
jgi:hypothetical protein